MWKQLLPKFYLLSKMNKCNDLNRILSHKLALQTSERSLIYYVFGQSNEWLDADIHTHFPNIHTIYGIIYTL